MIYEPPLEELIRRELQFEVAVDRKDPNTLEVEPRDFEVGFRFKVKAGLRSKRLRVEFSLGKFSRTLQTQIPKNLRSNATAFKMQVEYMEKLDGNLSIFNGGEKISVEDLVTMSQIGRDFKPIFKMERRENILLDDEKSMEAIVEFFSLVLLMVPVYHDDLGESIQTLDGTVRTITVNVYERNPTNRKLCIEHHGVRCKVCKVDFSERYGELGRGFIHVHHVLELSECQEAYVPDPVQDLVPVCPNCHAMLHRQKPALTVEALKKKLN